MTFAEWLQGRMRERNLSQADLARATGRSTNIVSLWYRGIKQPGVRSVPPLAAALGVAEVAVLRALNGAEPQEQRGDIVAALMQRIPEVPLNPSEVRLLCDLVEVYVWTIHRWGRHEHLLEEEERLQLLDGRVASENSVGAISPEGNRGHLYSRPRNGHFDSLDTAGEVR
jgi:transcriptional regulator with XRE-family HTH domain